MSDTIENEPVALFPPDETYDVAEVHVLKEGTLPHTPTSMTSRSTISKNTMGIFLSENAELTKVMYDGNLNRLRFNEPMNRMGKMIAALVMHDMALLKAGEKPVHEPIESLSPKKKSHTIEMEGTPRKEDKTKNGGKTPELAPLGAVYTTIATKLTDEAELEHDNIHPCRIKCCFLVMKGFNTDHDGNYLLDDVALKFSQIRLGFNPRETDELGAAMIAVELCYIKSQGFKKEVGNSSWTLPIVHMLNDHLILRKVTPINFHPIGSEDDKVSPIHESHCTTTWIKKTKCKVENHPTVIKELQDFAHKFTNKDLRALPAHEEPPEQRSAPSLTKRARRSISLGRKGP